MDGYDGAHESGERPLLYLVTGGSGFLGRKLVECLKKAGQRVRCLDRKECKPEDRIEGVEYMVGDVCDLASRSCYWCDPSLLPEAAPVQTPVNYDCPFALRGRPYHGDADEPCKTLFYAARNHISPGHASVGPSLVF